MKMDQQIISQILSIQILQFKILIIAKLKNNLNITNY